MECRSVHQRLRVRSPVGARTGGNRLMFPSHIDVSVFLSFSFSIIALLHIYLCTNTFLHFIFGAFQTKLQTSVHFLPDKSGYIPLMRIQYLAMVIRVFVCLFLLVTNMRNKKKKGTEKGERVPIHLRQCLSSSDFSCHSVSFLSLR